MRWRRALTAVGARGFEPRTSSVSRNERHAIYQHKTQPDLRECVRHRSLFTRCCSMFRGVPRDGISAQPEPKLPPSHRECTGRRPPGRYGPGTEKIAPHSSWFDSEAGLAVPPGRRAQSGSGAGKRVVATRPSYAFSQSLPGNSGTRLTSSRGGTPFGFDSATRPERAERPALRGPRGSSRV
jgi:hypothetical protein